MHQGRIVGGGITNTAQAGVIRKASIDKMSSVTAAKVMAPPSAPQVDVGRYDGGLERDERKGRRTGDHPDVLNIDSAAAG